MALELIKQVNGTNGPSLHDDMDPTQSPLPYQEDVPNIEGLILLPSGGTPADTTKKNHNSVTETGLPVDQGTMEPSEVGESSNAHAEPQFD